MADVTKIIDYQDDTQYTPKEALENVQKENSENPIDTVFILYRRKGDGLFFVMGGSDREYNNGQILWDLAKAKGCLLDSSNDGAE